MEREIIDIRPRLSNKHQQEFLIFCQRIKKHLRKKNTGERVNWLVQEKEIVNKVYSGKSFHSNTDLAFIENLLLDLMLQDWELIIQRGNIKLELLTADENDKNIDEEKAKTRRRHLLARDIQLKQVSVKEFIKNSEKRRITATGWHSIYSVMKDGSELSKQLSQINVLATEEDKINALNETIKPYLQIVEPGNKCEHTGLLLSEIWRYFRHTWINEYKSLPGRSISILVRDAGSANHPVIGIAALGSSVAQQTCRDKWIGWDGEAFTEKLKSDPSGKYAKWLINILAELIKEIYIKDFIKTNVITRAEINNPGKEKITKLRNLSIIYKAKHFQNPQRSKFSASNDELSWSERSESYLFKSKRSVLLAELLSIKLVFKKHNFLNGTKKELERCLEVKEFKDAVEKLVRKAKAIHVGINMMDIIVCGSVAPYNHLLGGKLVCMMLTSPEITQYYNYKYKDAISLIASSMNGKPINRKPQLVMLGTTSLYGIGSSQYNRIKIPAEAVEGIPGNNIEYKELGVSEGFGSFHFSNDTISLADAVVGRENGRSKVNSIFGEGANPLIRKLKDALEFLGLESRPILNHRNKRVVYGISLAENFGEVLLGLAERPKYLISQLNPKFKTELIGKYWINRWLINRVKREEVLQKVSEHTLSYPITHGARVPVAQNTKEITLFD